MKYIIREMFVYEYPLLSDFLYEAIYQRDENNLLPKTVIQEPSLQVYIENFGTMQDDYCMCAEVNKKTVGAVWVRNINGYGNVGNNTPERVYYGESNINKFKSAVLLIIYRFMKG